MAREELAVILLLVGGEVGRSEVGVVVLLWLGSVKSLGSVGACDPEVVGLLVVLWASDGIFSSVVFLVSLVVRLVSLLAFGVSTRGKLAVSSLADALLRHWVTGCEKQRVSMMLPFGRRCLSSSLIGVSG